MALNIKQATSQQRNRGRKWQVGDKLYLINENYFALLKHMTTRLELAKAQRARYIDVFKYIDKEYYAFLLRDADDQKRQRDNALGRGVKPTDEKLSMMFSQIDEAATYLLSVLAPDDSMYTAMASKDKQQIASAFAKLMNTHAKTFGHFRAYAMFLLTAMKYNFSGFGVHWQERMGNIVTSNSVGMPVITRDVVAMGNQIQAYDPYNILIDPSVAPVDVPESGEYFGVVDITTEFRLRKAEQEGEIFNVSDFVATDGMNYSYRPFYESKPAVRNDFGQNADMKTDWFSVFAYHNEAKESSVGYEIIRGFFWLIPSRFGLGNSNKYEIWEAVLGSDKTILSLKHADNAHGMLPINIAMPYEDNFGWQTKGAAERLVSHQQFGSFIMNTHKRATRKRLYGLTLYDSQRIPAMAQDTVDLEGGKVGFNSNGQDVDVNKLVKQFNDGPDTTNTLENIALLNELMQDILPTRMQQQVAGLDRATQYQAAAVVQSASRRNLRIAKTIDSQAMQRGRRMQMLNIQQKQRQIEILLDGGEVTTIDPKTLRETRIEFDVSDGLKGIDKLALTMNIKEVLNSLLQSQAAQSFDVAAIINYWTSMLGDNTDFRQFKITSPIDNLPAEQRNMAFQLLQQYAAQQEAQPQDGGAGAQSPMM